MGLLLSVMLTSGSGLTIVVIPSLIAEQPLALVTLTVTTWPLVKVPGVNVAVVLAVPWLTSSTKNSYLVPPDAVKVNSPPTHTELSTSLLLKTAVGNGLTVISIVLEVTFWGSRHLMP